MKASLIWLEILVGNLIIGVRGLWCLMPLSTIFQFYLTLHVYTFSFEINESRLSDTRCLIQDVVSPHRGDKRMVRCCTRRSLSNYFYMTSYHWNVRQNTVTWRWWMNGKNNVTSYTKRSLPQSIVHILIQPLLFV